GDERRERLQRNALRFLIFLGGLIVLAIAAVGYLSWLASDQRQKTAQAKLEARAAKAAADEAHVQATLASAERDKARNDATRADADRKDAEAKATIAEERQAQATANARRQERVANSLAQVEEAYRLIDERPADALAISAKAFYAAPAAVGTRSGLL